MGRRYGQRGFDDVLLQDFIDMVDAINDGTLPTRVLVLGGVQCMVHR
jgi:hypothetical protein